MNKQTDEIWKGMSKSEKKNVIEYAKALGVDKEDVLRSVGKALNNTKTEEFLEKAKEIFDES